MAIVDPPIKFIQLADGEHEIYDEYARRRLEGLTNVYSISCLHAGSSSNTYVDYKTGATITYSTMSIENTKFKNGSTEPIEITKTTGKTSYIVLESKTASGAYYAVRFLDMNIGDTVYVVETEAEIEGETVKIPDRWLSSATGETSATFSVLDGKIDLKEYAKRTEAAKPGTYTSSAASTETSGQGGEQTATGTASVTYKKADAETGSAGGATVTSTEGGAVSIEYTPAGTVSKPNINVTAPTVSVNTDAIKAVASEFTGTAATITISGSVTGTSVADHAAATLTISGSQVIATHSHSVTSATDTFTAVTDITGFTGGALNAATTKTVVTGVTAASLTGDTTFVKSITGWNGGTLTGTTTFNTDAIKAVAGTKNFGFTASQANIMTAPTVSDTGILSWTLATAGTQDAHTGTAASKATVGLTAATCTITSGTVGITGGTASGTTSVVPSYTLTAASLGTVSKGTITYVKSVNANTGNGGGATVSGANFTAALPKMTHSVTDGSFSGSTSYTPAGSISNTYTNANTTPVVSSVTAALAKTPVFTGTTAILSQAAHTHSVTIAAHTHTIGSSDATATGDASVAVSNHTHSIGHTHTVTIPAIDSSAE